MKIIDITIPLSNETPVWEGETGITILRSANLDEGGEYNVSRCEFGLHSGTHIDAPFHVMASGTTIDAIPLEKMIGTVQIVKVPSGVKVMDAVCLKGLKIDPSIKRVIFKTTNSQFWDQRPLKFNRGFVALDTSGAEYLLPMNMKLIGIDYFSISSFHDLRKPHEILLAEKIVLLENADLRQVEPGIYQLFCLPLKVIGTDGAPVRAILIKE